MQNSTQFMDDLGGLGAIWAGRDQGMQENTTLVNQQIGLENIANSQQTRQFNAEKHPYELSKLQHEQAMQPLKMEEQRTKNASEKVKLNKEKFDNMMSEIFSTVPTLPGTPADGAAIAEIAKKHEMDENDPRIRYIIDKAGAGDLNALNKLMKGIALASPKHQQEMAKEEYKESQANKRNTENRQSQERIAAGHDRTQLEIANRRLQAAQAKANQVKQSIDQQIAQLEGEMAKAEPQLKQQYANRIAYLMNIKKEINAASAEQRADDLEALIARISGGQIATPPPRPNPAATPPATGPNAPAAGGAPQAGGFTPQQEDWIARAMAANPGMTREQVVEQGKQKGKL